MASLDDSINNFHQHLSWYCGWFDSVRATSFQLLYLSQIRAKCFFRTLRICLYEYKMRHIMEHLRIMVWTCYYLDQSFGTYGISSLSYAITFILFLLWSFIKSLEYVLLYLLEEQELQQDNWKRIRFSVKNNSLLFIYSFRFFIKSSSPL